MTREIFVIDIIVLFVTWSKRCRRDIHQQSNIIS